MRIETKPGMGGGMRSRVGRAGFTLIEVMVVVIIIAVLATLIAPKIFSNIGKAKRNATIANAASLRTAVNNFMLNSGRSVKSGDTLRDILWDGSSNVPEGWTPSVNSEDALYDSWDNEFMIEIPGTKNLDFDIISYGSDGAPGGEGDAADIRE